jgi:hypothetical protein
MMAILLNRRRINQNFDLKPFVLISMIRTLENMNHNHSISTSSNEFDKMMRITEKPEPHDQSKIIFA